MDARYQLNLERFVKGRPQIKRPPEAVYINKIGKEELASNGAEKVNFPTLVTAGANKIHID